MVTTEMVDKCKASSYREHHTQLDVGQVASDVQLIGHKYFNKPEKIIYNKKRF